MKTSLGKKYKAWVRFFASMDLAITLLVMLAIASVIGTIIQQNQPYSAYAIKFGPFWFEIFKMLGLYNLYSQIWFLSGLAFLVLSIGFCVWHYTPIMLKNIRALPSMQTWQHLQYCKYTHLQTSQLSITAIAEKLAQDNRYRLSDIHTDKHHQTCWQITGKRGRGQKLGYLFTHIGVVVICVGALLDSSILLKVDHWLGHINHERRNITLDKIDRKSFLPSTNRTFRGSVSIPEGKSTRVIFLPWADGYLVQELPFIIELDDFRTEHYPTGQPSAFESDLIIRDLQGRFISTHTINVNHPLNIDGISIYQSSFEDGGSLLDLTLQPFYEQNITTFRLSVKKSQQLTLEQRPLSFELTNFRLYNIQPLEHSPNKFRNQGPSFQYKLRRADGTAIEYENYMLPIERDGQHFLISGVRQTPQDEFRYLYIPLDEHLSPQRFFTFLQWLKDERKLTQILSTSPVVAAQFPPQITLRMQKKMVQNFIEKGSESILKYVQTIQGSAQQAQMYQLFMDSLHLILSEVYIQLIYQENRDQGKRDFSRVTPKQATFYQQTVNSLSTINQYGYPVFFRAENFKHIQASGLQLTRTPGQFWVYLGCLLLVIGIFCMFYLPIAKIWVTLKDKQLLIALEGMKNDSDHDKELQRLIDLLA